MSGYTASVYPSLEIGWQFKKKDTVQMDLIHRAA